MKKIVIGLVLISGFLGSTVFAKTNFYICNTLKNSASDAKISISIDSKNTSVLSYSYYFSGSDKMNCQGTNGHIVKNSARVAYGVPGCNGDTRITISQEMLADGLVLKNGKAGGFVRIDNNEEGGYFQNNFICFKQ